MQTTRRLPETLRRDRPRTTWSTWTRGRADRSVSRGVAIGDERNPARSYVPLLQSLTSSEEVYPDRRVIHAASLATLIGVFRAAEMRPNFFNGLPEQEPRRQGDEDRFVCGSLHLDWLRLRKERAQKDAIPGPSVRSRMVSLHSLQEGG